MFYFVEKPGSCPKEEYSCDYPIYNEMSYKCLSDNMCPANYKCCHHSCYCHKVCFKPVAEITTDVQTTTVSDNEIFTIEISTEIQTEESEQFFSLRKHSTQLINMRFVLATTVAPASVTYKPSETVTTIDYGTSLAESDTEVTITDVTRPTENYTTESTIVNATETVTENTTVNANENSTTIGTDATSTILTETSPAGISAAENVTENTTLNANKNASNVDFPSRVLTESSTAQITTTETINVNLNESTIYIDISTTIPAETGPSEIATTETLTENTTETLNKNTTGTYTDTGTILFHICKFM